MALERAHPFSKTNRSRHAGGFAGRAALYGTRGKRICGNSTPTIGEQSPLVADWVNDVTLSHHLRNAFSNLRIDEASNGSPRRRASTTSETSSCRRRRDRRRRAVHALVRGRLRVVVLRRRGKRRRRPLGRRQRHGYSGTQIACRFAHKNRSGGNAGGAPGEKPCSTAPKIE